MFKRCRAGGRLGGYEEATGKVFARLTTAIAQGQARGEIRPGDPQLHAFSILGPMLAAMLFRTAFSATETPLPDLRRLAAQHAETVLGGLLLSSSDPRPDPDPAR